MEKENIILREYIIQLQSKLLDAGHRDFPPAPAELTRQTVAPSSSFPATLQPSPSDLEMEAQLQQEAAAHDNDSPDDDMDLGAQLQEAAAAAAAASRQIGGSGH